MSYSELDDTAIWQGRWESSIFEDRYGEITIQMDCNKCTVLMSWEGGHMNGRNFLVSMDISFPDDDSNTMHLSNVRQAMEFDLYSNLHKITGTYKTTEDIDGGTVELFASHEIAIPVKKSRSWCDIM